MAEQNRMLLALNKLTKWRTVFASWQLGTRLEHDAELLAVKDHRETTMLLRAEVSALVAILVAKGIFTSDEWCEALADEAGRLDADYENKFRGFATTQEGVTMDLEVIRMAGTMKGWRP